MLIHFCKMHYQILYFFCLFDFFVSSLATSLAASNYACEKESIQDQNFHFRGTNLGGWMVLEPWITPSLFYQFLGADQNMQENSKLKVAMDTYTFCSVLGPEEANKQLKRHWETWITEDDIARLAATGIDTLRLPVGDWMFKTYGPYTGCFDGALDQVNRIIDLAGRYGLQIFFDIHGLIGSQNGFDNSGKSMDVVWITDGSQFPTGNAMFVHWPIRKAGWMGEFDPRSGKYISINKSNIDHTLEVVAIITKTYANNKVVVGLQPVNEPWEYTPINVLKQFYWDTYQIVQKIAPNWILLMHDAFQGQNKTWEGFMKNCPNIAMDTHIYQAWKDPGPIETFYEDACNTRDKILHYEKKGFPMIVGEWSLATDNCALWLNGFNDNLPGFPKVECDWVDCPPPYMGNEQPGAPPNSMLGPQGPFGTGQSTPRWGKCPIDKSWGDNEKDIMSNLAHKKLNAFENGHGWFFWNFKSELEPKWSFLNAVSNGWIPNDIKNLQNLQEIQLACPNEQVSASLSLPSNQISLSAFYIGLLVAMALMIFSTPFVVYFLTLRSHSKYTKINSKSNKSYHTNV